MLRVHGFVSCFGPKPLTWISGLDLSLGSKAPFTPLLLVVRAHLRQQLIRPRLDLLAGRVIYPKSWQTPHPKAGMAQKPKPDDRAPPAPEGPVPWRFQFGTLWPPYLSKSCGNKPADRPRTNCW